MPFLSTKPQQISSGKPINSLVLPLNEKKGFLKDILRFWAITPPTLAQETRDKNTTSKTLNMKLHYAFLFFLAVAITSCNSPSVEDESELFEDTVQQTAIQISPIEADLFERVNDYRTTKGLNVLTFSDETYKLAQEHTQFMIIEDRISHDYFSDRAQEIAKVTNAVYVAENVAKEYPNAEMALQGWLDSDSHRKTIEGNFTHTVISIKENFEGKLFYTQIFFRK